MRLVKAKSSLIDYFKGLPDTFIRQIQDNADSYGDEDSIEFIQKLEELNLINNTTKEKEFADFMLKTLMKDEDFVENWLELSQRVDEGFATGEQQNNMLMLASIELLGGTPADIYLVLNNVQNK